MSLSRLLGRTAILSVCLLSIVCGARAQYRAGIQGTVTDAQGGVVPGANVTVTAQETGLAQSTATDASGVYSVTRLAPGLYKVSVEKTGFKKQVVQDVNIIGEQVSSVNVTVEVGQVAESVTVNGDSMVAIDTESGQLQGTVTNDQIQKMPSYGRDVFQLLQLAPGSFGDGSRAGGGGTSNLPGSEQGGTTATSGIFQTENAGQVSANGARTNQNNYQIDGVGVTSVSWGGTSVITPSEESVKEVKVVTNNYDAENGRYSGGQVQVISANGTNEFHGSAFIKNTQPGFNAYQRWNGPSSDSAGTPQERGLQKDTAKFNQIGGSLGGPIWKNKIFFFFSYETIRNNSTTTSQGWYETPQLLTMAPSGSIASKFLTFPGEGVSFSAIIPKTCADVGLIEGKNCATIPGKGLDVGRPLALPLGTADPSWQSNLNPGLGGDGTGSPANLDGIPDLMFVNTASPTTTTEEQYHGRLDFNATSKDLLAFSLYRVPVDTTFFNGPVRAANLWHHSATNEAETFLWDHTFSPTLVNEVRANAAGWRWNEINSNAQEPWGLPIAQITDLGALGINNTDGSPSPNNFGAPPPSVFDQWTYGAKDVLTKVYNNHTIKFGGEYTRLLFVDEQAYSGRPTYQFRNFWDFLNDSPYQENATFDPTTGVPTTFRKDTRESLDAVFVQDNFRARPNLTLTFGLRWEYFGPMTEKHGNLAVVQLGTGPDVLTGLTVRKGGSLYDSSGNNWGPEVGFAWSPTRVKSHEFGNKFVIRGGFGIGYNELEEAITLNGQNNPPFVSSNSTLTGAQILYGVPSDVHSFNGYPSNPFGITQFNSANLPVNSVVGVTAFPTALPTTYTYHYSLDMQYDLGHQWVASLGYQGSISRHLTEQYNLNFVYSQVAPLNPQVNNVDAYLNNGNANFNALLAELHHQFARTFEIDAQYRYSKSLDDGSNNFAIDNYQFDPRYAYGPSDFDVRHMVKIYGIWSPTIFTGGHSWLEKVVGGWSISGIFNWHTGFPWTPVYNNINNETTCNLIYIGGACANGATANLRPAAYLGGAGSNYSVSTFQKTNGNFPNGGPAYFTAPSYTPGPAFPGVGPLPGAPGVGRNSFRGPRYLDLDATISKSFGLPKMKVLGERARFEFRANLYNIFNNLNLTTIDNVVTDSHFGGAQQALGARIMELQARFSF
jgi:hypothetical protein